MIHARVDGHAVTSICHPSLNGQKIALCTPIDDKGHATGAPIAAIDPLGAGQHTLEVTFLANKDRAGKNLSTLMVSVLGLTF